jgi:hypothetical protein
VEGSRHGKPAPGADATEAWWVKAVREDQGAQVEVRLSGSAAAAGLDRLPPELGEAIQTKGKSAVEKFAWRFVLPRVLVLGTNGIFELSE